MSKLFQCLRNLVLASFFILISFFTLMPLGFAQGEDVEPNNPCPAAQDFGFVDLPFSVSGNLDPIGDVLDIDFFRFTGIPGDLVQADHQGAATGAGTLGDPLLGFFDGDCNLIDLNDDTGTSDSRLFFFVPENGEYILAATAFPDYSFAGFGEGSYLLTLSAPQLIDSIRGRLVDASDGITPLSGDSPTYAWAQLFRCSDGFCSEYIGYQQADLDGNFYFESDSFGPVLLAGSFQIQAWANGYEYHMSEPFDVLENEALDLGDIAMAPLKLIGQVSGRLVDAQDGSPINGFGPPWASVVLERCDEYGCGGVSGLQPDDLGNFRFDGVLYQLPPGTYRVTADAEGYQQTTTSAFDLAESENIDLGDIGMMPNQLQFGEVTACQTLQAGGKCEFGIELRNRGPGRFKGQVWGLVEFYTSYPPLSSRFQVGKLGMTNPMPERVNLQVGQAVSMRFQLNVPKDVPGNSVVCAFAAVGADPAPQFHSLGERFLFCGATQLGQFELLSEKDGRKRLRELKGKQ